MTRRIDKITREALIVLGAGPDCDRLAAFVAVFPGGSALTEEAYDRAVAAGLDLAWLAKRILPESARAEFDKAVAPAMKAAYVATFWGAEPNGD